MPLNGLLNFFEGLMETPPMTITIAFLSGLIPVLIWLWFLEREDENPEPKRLIFLSFIAGMVAVIVAIPLEYYFQSQGFTSNEVGPTLITTLFAYGPTLIIWSVIEELTKFLGAAITVLWRKDNDEPIDSMMYMVAVALGFAALENAIFILTPIKIGNAAQAVITADLRFMGATLLHVVTSSVVGASLALAFYKTRKVRAIYLTVGLILAVSLHAVFNLSIMSGSGSLAVYAFYLIWAALVGVLLFFEKAKFIKKQ